MNIIKLDVMLKEAEFFERIEDKRVRCTLCQRECLISTGKRGFCGVRVNIDGVLKTLIYGEVAYIAVSPIEKKPFFHFYPGSTWLSLGTLGCNFKCPGCQNWDIAHKVPETMEESDIIPECNYFTPEDVINAAKKYNCLGISWTYNEPTIWFEFAYETSRRAKKEGLLSNYVSNGFISPLALDTIAPYLDAIRIDIKGFSKSTYKKIAHIDDFKGILSIAERVKRKHGIHLEIITNLIPQINDNENELKGIAKWIKQKLGSETPWHITRFYPACKLSHIPPTPISLLERTRELAIKTGLEYVYLGNVPRHPFENTYCHHCGKILIERYSISILKNYLKRKICPFCGGKIEIIL